MPPDQRGVYDTIINLIYAHGDDDGGIEFNESDLAIRCCCHWREFRRILAALLTRGKVAQDGRRIYVTRCAEELQKAGNRVTRAQQNAAKRWNNNDIANAGAQTPSNARARAIHQPSNNKHHKETRASRASSNEGFDRWWEGYPNKVGKGAARMAFGKALTKTSLDQLIAGVQRYKATKLVDRPWCNPATWLNQERWLDAPAATNGYDASVSLSRVPRGPLPTAEELGLVPNLH
jgi:hypothetical protein